MCQRTEMLDHRETHNGLLCKQKFVCLQGNSKGLF